MREILKRMIDEIDEKYLADLLWILQQYARKRKEAGAAD